MCPSANHATPADEPARRPWRRRAGYVAVPALAAAAFGAQLAAGAVTVEPGDTVWSLAQANDTTVEALARRNGLADPNHIVVGEVLSISGSSAGAPAAGGGDGRIVVKKGDTLWSLAQRHGTSAAALVYANGIDDAGHIEVGQVLDIPEGAPSPSAPAPSTGPGGAPEAGPAQKPAATQRPKPKPTAEPQAAPAAPTTTAAPAPAPTGPPTIVSLYRVQPGDTPDSIAALFGIGVDSLLVVNQLAPGDAITVDDYIRIPSN